MGMVTEFMRKSVVCDSPLLEGIASSASLGSRGLVALVYSLSFDLVNDKKF